MKARSVARIIAYLMWPAAGIAMLVLPAVGIAMFGISAPTLFKKPKSRLKVCWENLDKISDSKELFAKAKNLKSGDPVDPKELAAYGGLFPNGIPQCPTEVAYILNNIGTPPECRSGLPGHSYSEIRR